MPFAVGATVVATPLALVTAVVVLDPPNVALAPLAGAVNVTVTPATGLPPLSTVACSPAPNAVVTFALCGVPAVAATVGGSAVFVSAKLPVVAPPLTLATTV